STMEHDGPMTVWPISSTRMPASGSSPPLRSGAFMPAASPLLARRRAQLREAAAELDRARQRMADDVFGKARALEQLVEIEAGIDAHLLAHEHQVFRADVARGALVAGEGAAAEARVAGVEAVHAHLQRRVSIGDAHAARIVQMQVEAHAGMLVAQRAD